MDKDIYSTLADSRPLIALIYNYLLKIQFTTTNKEDKIQLQIPNHSKTRQLKTVLSITTLQTWCLNLVSLPVTRMLKIVISGVHSWLVVYIWSKKDNHMPLTRLDSRVLELLRLLISDWLKFHHYNLCFTSLNLHFNDLLNGKLHWNVKM